MLTPQFSPIIFRVTKRRPLKLFLRKRRIKPRFFEHKRSEVVVSYLSIYERIVDNSKSLGRCSRSKEHGIKTREAEICSDI